MKKICIVEDDIGISKSLKLYLENSDFEVVTYETGQWASEFILNSSADLVILDINLPEKDWIAVCSELRESSGIPVIMLTARWGELDRVTWLEVWADDYISKPFSPRELLARINSILRRVTPEEKDDENVIKIWDMIIDLKQNVVTTRWEEIAITKNEFDILAEIAKWKWALVTRESLMKDVIWYDNYVYDRTIDTHIKNLRKKIWDKELIITVRGKWYKMKI